MRRWRWDLSRSLVTVGGLLLGMGLILLVVKMLIIIAYTAAGAMAVVGLIALVAGLLMGRR